MMSPSSRNVLGGTMRTRTASTALTGLLLAALTACGGAGSGDAKPEPAKATSPAPSKTATPSPTPDLPMPFGKTINVTDDADGSKATVTVLGYEQGIKAQTSADEEFGTNGYVWAAIELKLCAKKGTSGATRFPWALAYADGARIEPSDVTYGDFPQPEYPYEAMVKEGDCIRGKTVFAVPGKQRPERVLYTTELFDTPPEWAVPKA